MITLETNCLYICRNQTVVRTAMGTLNDGHHITARTASGIEHTYNLDKGLLMNVPAGSDPLDIVAEFFPRGLQPPFSPDTLVIVRLAPKGPIVSMRSRTFAHDEGVLSVAGRSAPLELLDGVPMLGTSRIVEKGQWYVRRDGDVFCAGEPGDDGRVAVRQEKYEPVITVDQHTGLVARYQPSPYDLVAVALESIIPKAMPPMPPPVPAPPPAPPWPLPAGHKHAALMLEYAQDAAKTPTPWLGWQVRGVDGEFRDLNDNPSWTPSVSFRRKPYEITVGDVTIDGPLREAPAQGTEVYCAHPLQENGVNRIVWRDYPDHRRWLAQGLLYDTHERAKQCSDALLRVLHV